ncbi:MAG TPA: hypothetical protein VGR73_13580 [Bryobacteraceae bacterium]|nr:hypothetical protein [Bryobacteraceae bacterium]
MENGEAPASKRDIEQFRSEMSRAHHDLVERIGDRETRLLKAFYNFGQPNSKRMTEPDE